ncbi:MAG: DUF1566 domain-containing protein [Polyangiales bacterium]
MKRQHVRWASMIAASAALASYGCKHKPTEAGPTSDTVASVDSSWPDVPLPPRGAQGARERLTVTGESIDDFVTQLTWARRPQPTSLAYASAEKQCAERPEGPWRIPSRLELLSTLDLSHTAPYLDTKLFGAVADGPFWSSTPVAGADGQHWTVSFATGFTQPSAVKEAWVRCVKGPIATSPRPRFRIAGKTVIDDASKLIWTREAVVPAIKQLDAAEACRRLSLDGIRGFHIPARVELETMLDTRRRSPAVDTDSFVVIPHEIDWSANGTGDSIHQAWLVSLEDGQSRRDDLDELHSLRCVKAM